MERRSLLAAVSAVGVAGVAGCLESLGFERESAWRTPPLVSDRPAAVYVPASREEMGMYGRTEAGPYGVALTYTVPHRFWLVTGDRERVDVTVDDTHHLMCLVWDDRTGTVLPAEVTIELERDGATVDRFAPWPMVSQRMGFHYGDNVTLPEAGPYRARIDVGPLGVTGAGGFADRLDGTHRAEIAFEYAREDINGLSFEVLDEDERGHRGAQPLMDHDLPTATRSAAELPGRHLGTERTGDAAITPFLTDRPAGAGQLLAVSLRTPYNDIPLPFASLVARIDRGTDVVERPLEERTGPTRGHHYALSLASPLRAGDVITLEVTAPPAVSRHAGYETAFLAFDPVSFEVP